MRLQRRRRSPGASSSGARGRGRRQALPFAIARCSAHASPRADAAEASAHRGEHGGQHVQHFSAVRRGAGRQNAPAAGDARAAPRAGRHRGLAAPRLLRRLLLGRHHGAAAGEARPARRERLTRGVRRTRAGPNPKRAGATPRSGRRALTPPSAPGARVGRRRARLASLAENGTTPFSARRDRPDPLEHPQAAWTRACSRGGDAEARRAGARPAAAMETEQSLAERRKLRVTYRELIHNATGARRERCAPRARRCGAAAPCLGRKLTAPCPLLAAVRPRRATRRVRARLRAAGEDAGRGGRPAPRRCAPCASLRLASQA